MTKNRLTLLARTSNFAVWLGTGCFVALQVMRLDILVFDADGKIFIGKMLSYLIVACCVLSGPKLGTWLLTSKSVLKDAVKKEIENEQG